MVPLLKTLRKLFSHEDLFGSIVEVLGYPANVYKNFSDGSVFSDNELFQKHPKSIQIIFYHDEFQIANALGNKTHKYKIASFYYVLGNLSAKYRAKLKDVHLAILCEASLMKTHSYSAILRPFLDDVKILETEGLEIVFEESTHKFFGTISMLVADNLAAQCHWWLLSKLLHQCNEVTKLCCYISVTLFKLNSHQNKISAARYYVEHSFTACFTASQAYKY